LHSCTDVLFFSVGWYKQFTYCFVHRMARKNWT